MEEGEEEGSMKLGRFILRQNRKGTERADKQTADLPPPCRPITEKNSNQYLNKLVDLITRLETV